MVHRARRHQGQPVQVCGEGARVQGAQLAPEAVAEQHQGGTWEPFAAGTDDRGDVQGYQLVVPEIHLPRGPHLAVAVPAQVHGDRGRPLRGQRLGHPVVGPGTHAHGRDHEHHHPGRARGRPVHGGGNGCAVVRVDPPGAVRARVHRGSPGCGGRIPSRPWGAGCPFMFVSILSSGGFRKMHDLYTVLRRFDGKPSLTRTISWAAIGR